MPATAMVNQLFGRADTIWIGEHKITRTEFGYTVWRNLGNEEFEDRGTHRNATNAIQAVSEFA